jgi:hypothetical protein
VRPTAYGCVVALFWSPAQLRAESLSFPGIATGSAVCRYSPCCVSDSLELLAISGKHAPQSARPASFDSHHQCRGV